MACVRRLRSKGQCPQHVPGLAETEASRSRRCKISQPRGGQKHLKRQYLRQASACIQPKPCCTRSAAHPAPTFFRQCVLVQPTISPRVRSSMSPCLKPCACVLSTARQRHASDCIRESLAKTSWRCGAASTQPLMVRGQAKRSCGAPHLSQTQPAEARLESPAPCGDRAASARRPPPPRHSSAHSARCNQQSGILFWLWLVQFSKSHIFRNNRIDPSKHIGWRHSPDLGMPRRSQPTGFKAQFGSTRRPAESQTPDFCQPGSL